MMEDYGVGLLLQKFISDVRERYCFTGDDSNRRLIAAAIRLCELDGGDPNVIVMGYSGYRLCFAGSSKRITVLQSPLRPLWTHYIGDAQNAFDLVAEIEAKAAKPKGEGNK